jgi:hypothetical protein
MIKDTADEELLNIFRENTLSHLEKAAGKKTQVGKIDGAKLNEEPYNKVYEITFESKHEMDKILASVEGRKFNRNITSFTQHISIFFVDYED